MNNPNYVVKGKEKFAYGFVAVGSHMVSGIVSSYFLNYVTDILILKEWWFIIVLLLVGRISDMITDPLMGIVVDKTHTKAGKMRPYVKVGSFLIGIVAILMFFPLSGAEPGKMVWAMIMYVGFGLAYTLVDVPAMGMMSVATPDKDERAGLLSFYVTVGSIGGLLPTVLYMVLDFFVPAKWIYFVLAVIVGLTAFAAYLYLYFHSKERFATSTEKISVKDMMKVVAKNKPMVLALLMSMLASPRYMIMSVAIYISIYVVTIPGLESGTVLVLLYIVVGAGMFAGILLTPPTYKKFGYKKASLIYGAIGAVFLGCGFGVGLVNIYAALPFMTIGGFGLGAGRIVAGGVGPCDEQRLGMAAAERVRELFPERPDGIGRPQPGVAQRGFAVISRHGGLGQQDELRRSGHFVQQVDDVALLPGVVAVELVVAVDVGLDDAHRDAPLVGQLPSRAYDEREGDREDDGRRRGDPPPQGTGAQGLEEEDVAEDHPERTSEYTRVFVPLYGPYVVREAVSEGEPRPGEVPDGVPVFGGDPCGCEGDVCEGFGGFFRDGVEEHEGCHVHRCRGEDRGDGPDGRGVPDPPYGADVPQGEGQGCPPEHVPPGTARGVVGGADPQQGDESRQQGQPREPEPSGTEEDDRKDYRSESPRHGSGILRRQK